MEESKNQEPREINRAAELASISSDDISESIADVFVATDAPLNMGPISIVDEKVFCQQDVEYMETKDRQKCDTFLRMAGVNQYNCDIDALMHGIVYPSNSYHRSGSASQPIARQSVVACLSEASVVRA